MSTRWRVSAAALFVAMPFLASPAAAADDISGRWGAQFGTPYWMDLNLKGEEVTGALVSPRSGNKYPIEKGTFRDSTLKLTVPSKKATVEAKLSGDRLEGKYTWGDESGKFLATRAGLPGKWRATVLVTDGREMTGTLEFAEKDGKLSGKIVTDRGSVDLKSVEAKDGDVVFTVSYTRDGQTREYTVEAAFEGADALKGKWKSADGSETGEFKATREGKPGKAPELAGRYLVTANLPDGQTMRVTFEAKVEGEKLAGSVILRSGQKVPVLDGSYREGRFELEADIPYEGQTARVKVTGTAGDKGVLRGSWSTDQGSGDWTGRPIEDI